MRCNLYCTGKPFIFIQNLSFKSVLNSESLSICLFLDEHSAYVASVLLEKHVYKTNGCSFVLKYIICCAKYYISPFKLCMQAFEETEQHVDEQLDSCSHGQSDRSLQSFLSRPSFSGRQSRQPLSPFLSFLEVRLS